jgi:hypothetical protein
LKPSKYCLKKKIPASDPLSRGQQRHPGEAGEAELVRVVAAPGSGLPGARAGAEGRRGEAAQISFAGDAVRSPAKRRGSRRIKEAAWKEGRKERGRDGNSRRSRELGCGGGGSSGPREATFCFCYFPSY